MISQSEYRPATRWYLFQFLPVLPLAIIAFLLYANNDMLWLVSLLTVVTAGYVLFVSYRIVRQMRTPIVILDDKGIRVRVVGAVHKDFSWDSISDIYESSFCIKLRINGQEDSIPTNSLNSTDKQALLSAILSRTQG